VQGIVISSWSRDGGKTRKRKREREREKNWEGEEEEESSALYCQSTSVISEGVQSLGSSGRCQTFDLDHLLLRRHLSLPRLLGKERSQQGDLTIAMTSCTKSLLVRTGLRQLSITVSIVFSAPLGTSDDDALL
jgi:hypothetical protein